MVDVPLTHLEPRRAPLSRGLGLTIAATISLSMWMGIARLLGGG